MRSQHGDEFNHDPWAADYDEDVKDEANPIRAGYADTLAWTVERAAITANDIVVDLGVGTGNTSALIPEARRLLAVDLSKAMMARARSKLAHLADLCWFESDLLAFFDEPRVFDRVVSTYAIHHLTAAEKSRLFRLIMRDLTAGGRAVFGDLMFADAEARREIVARFAAAGNTAMVETFDEEFFWLVDESVASLSEVGFRIDEVRRLSELSWGVCAVKVL